MGEDNLGGVLSSSLWVLGSQALEPGVAPVPFPADRRPADPHLALSQVLGSQAQASFVTVQQGHYLLTPSPTLASPLLLMNLL